MSDRRPGLLSLILVPAIITLVVTVVRVVGELQGWNPTLFGGQGSIVGISWLIAVFGFYFGWRLKRSSGSPHLGRAAILYLAGLAAFFGSVYGFSTAGLISMPTVEAPGPMVGLPYMLAAMGIAAVLGLAAWPRLSLVLIAYGLLARIPVVIVTYLDLQNGWGTHYGIPGPGVVFEESEKLIGLAMPQLTFWPFVATPIGGGLLGCLGARLAGGKR